MADQTSRLATVITAGATGAVVSGGFQAATSATGLSGPENLNRATRLTAATEFLAAAEEVGKMSTLTDRLYTKLQGGVISLETAEDRERRHDAAYYASLDEGDDVPALLIYDLDRVAGEGVLGRGLAVIAAAGQADRGTAHRAAGDRDGSAAGGGHRGDGLIG